MDIVSEIRENREKGAKILENEYKGRLMPIALRLCADYSEAESLVYHTFEEVISSIDSYTERSAFFAWMCKILVNCHGKSIRRKSNRTVQYTDVPPEVAVEDGAERVFRAIDAGFLREAIESLPKEMKEAVILRYFLDQPVAKIAQLLSLPIGTIKSRLYYARVILGERLGRTMKKPAALVAAVLLLVGVVSAAWVSGAKDAILPDSLSRNGEAAAPVSAGGTVYERPMGEDGEPVEEERLQSVGPAAGMSTDGMISNTETEETKMGKMRSMIGATMLAATATAATTCTWNGGDWSEPSNWTGGIQPSEAGGDSVTLQSPAADTVFNVDKESVSVNSLTTGGNSLILKGGKIALSGGFKAGVATVCSNELAFSYTYASMQMDKTALFYGAITATGSQLKLGGAGGAEFHCSITAPNTHLDYGLVAWAIGSYYFYGPLRVSYLGVANNYEGSHYYFCATGNEWTNVTIGYGTYWPSCAYAMPESTVVNFNTSEYCADKSRVFDLRGYDQAVDRVTSPNPVAGKSLFFVKSTGSTDASPATLTLKATASDSNYVELDGAINVVYAPTDPAFVQTFNDRAHTMSGAIVVSNGTFKVGGSSTFANVKSVLVAKNAILDMMDATSSGILSGVTSITVESGGKFLIGDAAVEAFTAQQVALDLASDCEFRLPAGSSYLFTKVLVDGVPLDGGTHRGGEAPFTGPGSLDVPEPEVETVYATWTGAGETDAITADANWEDGTTPNLLAGGLYPLFADGGETATVSGAMNWKGIRFGGTVGAFALKGEGDSARIAVRKLGIDVADAHTACVDVPLEVKNDIDFNVGTDSTLILSNAVTMAHPYAVTNTGFGTVSLCSTNNGFAGAYHIGSDSVVGGIVEVHAPTNAFGPPSDEELVVHAVAPGDGSSYQPYSHGKLYLYGTTIERPLRITGMANCYYPLTCNEGTNVFTRKMTFAVGARPRIVSGAVLIAEGGITTSGWFMPCGGASGTWIVRNEPAAFGYFYLADAPTFHLEVAGNSFSTLDFNSGRIVCDVDYAFNLTGGSMYWNNAKSVLDLNGHTQSLGGFRSEAGYTKGGRIVSEVAADLVINQSTSVTNHGVVFEGRAGLVKAGSGALHLGCAMASAGAITVNAGVLDFVDDGEWKDASSVMVSGSGRLVLGSKGQIGRKSDFTLADSGVVEIAEGVVARCASLTVDGKSVSNGIYGGDESVGPSVNREYAGHFAGKGVLQVGATGILLIVR